MPLDPNAASVDFLKLLTVVNAVASTVQTGRTGIQAISNPLTTNLSTNTLSTTTTTGGVPVISTVPTSF